MSVQSVAPHDTVTFVADSLLTIVPEYERLAAAYRQAWKITCVLSDIDGRLVAGQPTCAADCACAAQCMAARKQAIEESVRWGEPSILMCPEENLIWAVPIMQNSQVLGGLIATQVESVATHASGGASAKSPAPKDVRHAAADLLDLATRANLTNPALLALRRMDTQRESERAKAIHELKSQGYQSIREIYLVEEPALIAAIKQGDRPRARGIINRVLTGIYYLGRDRPLLLKSFLLELVVMMSRTAVEAGADPSELLGANFSSLADLAGIEGEEELCAWLVAMLERIMDAIKTNQHYPIGVMLGSALAHMQEHLHEDLSRDDVAKVACLSPSHFSRVVKQTFNHSFTELLTQMRVERAKEMLLRTEKSLIQICLDCGFNDQSYFTKVFQKNTGTPPGEFRRQRRIL